MYTKYWLKRQLKFQFVHCSCTSFERNNAIHINRVNNIIFECLKRFFYSINRQNNVIVFLLQVILLWNPVSVDKMMNVCLFVHTFTTKNMWYEQALFSCQSTFNIRWVLMWQFVRTLSLIYINVLQYFNTLVLSRSHALRVDSWITVGSGFDAHPGKT